MRPIPSTSALAALGSWKQLIFAAVWSPPPVSSSSAAAVVSAVETVPASAAALSKYTAPVSSFSVMAREPVLCAFASASASAVNGAAESSVPCIASAVERSGSWFYYDGNRIGQGKDAAKKYIEENKELQKELEDKLKAMKDRIELKEEPAILGDDEDESGEFDISVLGLDD